MVSADDISRTIEPGSTEFGERDDIEANLQSAIPQLQGSAGPASPGLLPSGGAGSSVNPMQELLGGEVSDLPVTDGMSVGPGAGPGQTAQGVADSPTMNKLRLLATEAKNPVLRQKARNALRAELRRGR